MINKVEKNALEDYKEELKKMYNKYNRSFSEKINKIQVETI